MKKAGRLFASMIAAIMGLFTGCGEDGPVTALYMGPPPEVGGTVTDASTDNPIAALRVELLRGTESRGLTNTTPDGTFLFILNYGEEGTNYTIRITDEDGAANGEYRGLTNTVFVSHSFYTNYKLEQK